MSEQLPDTKKLVSLLLQRSNQAATTPENSVPTMSSPMPYLSNPTTPKTPDINDLLKQFQPKQIATNTNDNSLSQMAQFLSNFSAANNYSIKPPRVSHKNSSNESTIITKSLDETMRRHYNMLSVLCRLCGEICGGINPNTKKRSYADEIRVLFMIDIEHDKALVHPNKICYKCRSLLDRIRKRIKQHKKLDEIQPRAAAVFDEHGPDCKLCAKSCPVCFVYDGNYRNDQDLDTSFEEKKAVADITEAENTIVQKTVENDETYPLDQGVIDAGNVHITGRQVHMRHKVLLQSICRLCGGLAIKCRPKEHFSEQIQRLCGIDPLEDSPEIHPRYVCSLCCKKFYYRSSHVRPSGNCL